MSQELEALKFIKNVEVEIGNDLNTATKVFELNHEYDKAFEILEKGLKQAEENEKLLNVFRNALTVERDIPPELEIKESEKGRSYVFREAVKIHENRIEEMYKKSLREWVIKNAFPKELKERQQLLKENLVLSIKEKALQIIIKKEVDVFIFLHSGGLEPYNDMVGYNRKLIPEEYDLLKEVML